MLPLLLQGLLGLPCCADQLLLLLAALHLHASPPECHAATNQGVISVQGITADPRRQFNEA
jgi:hypothetical protein